MSAITNLVLNDGTADQTFTPQSKDGNLVAWSVPQSSFQLSYKIVADAKSTKSTSNNRRIKYTVGIPFVDTSINDVKAYKVAYFNCELNVPKVTPKATLTVLRNIVANLLKDSLIVDQIDNGNNPY